ncbi:hypothetical protein AK812_SmicGene5289 [Symbiodinium microadriaticum]|uniref:Uncharacterized protein n=1 Tax=Symbiodinium microadriaticum TaxID=2951 RepID=A0A1Q9EU65_SYMMI|nr:hypothetical protein AK812_SmicGene5289 [Symbiodinium microadriaticum]
MAPLDDVSTEELSVHDSAEEEEEEDTDDLLDFGYSESVAEEIRALNAEMDECLAGLDQWREQRAREREALEKQLEDEYVAGHDDVEVQSPSWAQRVAHVPEIAEGVPAEGPLRAEVVVAGTDALRLEELQVGERRLAKLRKEVEELRRREAAGELVEGDTDLDTRPQDLERMEMRLMAARGAAEEAQQANLGLLIFWHQLGTSGSTSSFLRELANSLVMKEADEKELVGDHRFATERVYWLSKPAVPGVLTPPDWFLVFFRWPSRWGGNPGGISRENVIPGLTRGLSANSATPFEFNFYDRGNWGIILHCWSSGFVSGGFSAFLMGVVAGYLNVNADIIRGLQNMSSLPNVFSILMGIVSDSRPIFGYRRRPYLVFGWIMSTTAYSVMAVMGLPEPYFCVGPDGDYLLDQEPCNPDADQYYVPLMICLFTANIGLLVSGSAGRGLMVEYARAEAEERRGRTQTVLSMVGLVGQFSSLLVAGFGFNGRLFNGTWDQRYQLGFRQSLFESKAVAAAGLYFFVRAILAKVFTTASFWVMMEAWRYRSWLLQKYMLNVSWRKIMLVATVTCTAMDALPTFLTIFGIVRDQYFYLGESIVSAIPEAMAGLVSSFVVNELADDSNCGLLAGLFMTISNVATPMGLLLGNQLFGLFTPSLAERQNFVEDAPSFRRTVAWSYVLTYTFSILPLFLLPLLPRQKSNAQARKREWPQRSFFAVVAAIVLSISLLYTLVGDFFVLDPDLVCARFVGGPGCNLAKKLSDPIQD